MKNIIYKFLISLMILTGCHLVDPTDVVNPNLTEEAILDTDNVMSSWLAGCERQIAMVYNTIIVNSEIASDNYANTQTFYNQFLDRLNIVWIDGEINQLQYRTHRLREMALYGLNIVKDADAASTNDDLSKLHFYKGLSEMILSEYFTSVPGEPGGVLLASSQHNEMAIASFTEALNLATTAENRASALMGRARANYYAGNKQDAVNDAQAVIGLSGNFLRFANFDQVNTPTNTMQLALFDRGNFDDLQPLPRLEFLDPKYSFIAASQASPAPIQKVEEAYLILAEAAAVDQNFDDVKSFLNDLLTVVDTREKRTILDPDRRSTRAPGAWPNESDVTVAASPSDPLRPGLVLTRIIKSDDEEEDDVVVPVAVPVVSGTSVTPVMIDAITSEDEALELIYLMRQEIFIAEGRRVVDLGIKFVVSEIEVLGNDNISEGDPSTLKNLPAFIEAISSELDAFEYDRANKTCIIKHNLNKVLVQNKSSNAVLPFN